MTWKEYNKTMTFDIPRDYQKTIMDNLLATGNSFGEIYILGLFGYIFPNENIYSSGRISIKGKQGENVSIEFNYEFNGNKLEVSGFQVWGELNLNFAVRLFKEFVNENLNS